MIKRIQKTALSLSRVMFWIVIIMLIGELILWGENGKFESLWRAPTAD